LIRSAFFGHNEFSSISKEQLVHKIDAPQNIRKGSSEEVISGSNGVLVFCFLNLQDR
jgi:hypothetical protein